MKKTTQQIKAIALGIAVALGASYAFAWTGPTTTPPGGNVAAPLNVSSATQTKLGNLVLNGLSVATASIFTGTVQLDLGTPVAGEVLTAADASGTASWQASASSNTLNTGSAATTTQVRIDTGSWTDIGLDVTVTPTSASSKFLINADVIGMNGGASGNCDIGLFRGSTTLEAPYASYEGDGWDAFPAGITYIDSVTGTSPVTYKAEVKGDQNGSSGTCYLNRAANGTYGGVSTITVVEVK